MNNLSKEITIYVMYDGKGPYKFNDKYEASDFILRYE